MFVSAGLSAWPQREQRAFAATVSPQLSQTMVGTVHFH
jgi:hypothetical protein